MECPKKQLTCKRIRLCLKSVFSLPEITSITQTACYGEENGQVTVQATGGQEPYVYIWGNRSIGQTITDLAAGEYAVSVTEDNGCHETTTVAIEEYLYPIDIQSNFGNEIPVKLGDTISSIILSSNADLYTTYNWLPDDGLLCTNCPVNYI